MKLSKNLRAALLLNAATLLWAFNVTVGRSIRTLAGPWTITGARCLVASLLFAVLWFAGGHGKKPPPTRREWILLAVMGLSGAIGFQVLQYAGLRHTSAANAGMINALNPLVTIVLAWAFLGAHVGFLGAVGAAASLLGVALLILGGGAAGAGFSVNPGDLLVLAAVVLWGVYTIAGKALLDRRDTVWVTSLSTFIACPVALAAASFEVSSIPPDFSPALLGALAFIGVGPAFTAFLAWNEGVRLLGPNRATVFINTMALYATMLSAYLLGEPPTLTALAGGGLIVAGCLMALGGREK